VEVGSIIRDVFTGRKSEVISDRIFSLWSKRYNVWRDLPLTLILGETLQVPGHLRDLAISYTVSTKDNKPLMLIDMLSPSAPSPKQIEAYNLAEQDGIPVHYIVLPQESYIKDEYHINIVDSIITSTIGAEYAAEEHAEYEQVQQPFLNHVAVEMPGEGSSPMILDWYGGDEVDATTKYDPLADKLQRLRSQFIGSDRDTCPWGAGGLSCTVKAIVSPIDVGPKEGMVGRSMTISTHLGDAASGPVWVSKFDKADVIASRLAGILALGVAMDLIESRH